MSLRPQESRTEARKRSYKTDVDGDGAKRRREDNLVAIKKNKREDSHFAAADREKQLESISLMVKSENTDSQLEATRQFGMLLSVEGNPLIGEVIQRVFIPRFVKFLEKNDAPPLQIEATWALASVVSGTTGHIEAVIEHGAIPMFMRLLSSASDEVREQAVWALGILACDSPTCRDLVLGCGTLVPLLRNLTESPRDSMLRNLTWTLSNLCRSVSPELFEQVKPALPVLCQLLHSEDEKVLADACWALFYLSDNKVQAVIEAIAGAGVKQLVQLLSHPSQKVQIPALRVIGNIAKDGAIQTQEVVGAKIIQPLVQLLQTAEFDIKREAAWAISNATSGLSHVQICYLVYQGCIKPLCDLLECHDPRTLNVCLEGLENILKVGESYKGSCKLNGTNRYAALIDKFEGSDKIKSLQNNENRDISDKAVKLLGTYWTEADDKEEGPYWDEEEFQEEGKNTNEEPPDEDDSEKEWESLSEYFTDSDDADDKEESP